MTRAALAVALAVVIAAALASCRSSARRSGREDFAANAASTAPLRVFATGDARGFLQSCGCERGQVGGVARRLTYRERTRRPGDLWIDLGNLSQGTGEQRRVRRDAALDALALTGYDALVPGRVEVLEGASFEEAAKARDVPVVCANVVDAEGAPVFAPYVVRDLPDGRRVAIVGLCDAIDAEAGAKAGRRTLPPAGALRTAVLDLEGKADVVIAGAAMSVAEAQRLARDVPGVAVVLAGVTPEGEGKDVAFDASAPALVAVAGHLGEYVARIDFGADLRPATTWRAWMEEDLVPDPRGVAIVHLYKEAVAAIDVEYVSRLVAAKRAEGYAGSESCAPCHQADYDTWKRSLHGRAMEILVERKSSRDPDCVPCHLVDVPPSPAGAPFDADKMGVGCEACHGPSAAHNADPKIKTPARDSGKSTCASKCHHPPEVKNFDFAVQWPRIKHGR